MLRAFPPEHIWFTAFVYQEHLANTLFLCWPPVREQKLRWNRAREHDSSSGAQLFTHFTPDCWHNITYKHASNRLLIHSCKTVCFTCTNVVSLYEHPEHPPGSRKTVSGTTFPFKTMCILICILNVTMCILNVLVPLVGGLLCSIQEDRRSDCSSFLPTVSSAVTGWTERIKILHVEMQEEHMDKPAVETHWERQEGRWAGALFSMGCNRWSCWLHNLKITWFALSEWKRQGKFLHTAYTDRTGWNGLMAANTFAMKRLDWHLPQIVTFPDIQDSCL